MNAPEYRSLCRLVRGLRAGHLAARRIQSKRAAGAAEGLRASLLDLVRWGKQNRPGAVKRWQAQKRKR